MAAANAVMETLHQGDHIIASKQVNNTTQPLHKLAIKPKCHMKMSTSFCIFEKFVLVYQTKPSSLGKR